jgi:hypothetical protein
VLGGTAIAMTLFGDNDHLGGKLPYTMYAAPVYWVVCLCMGTGVPRRGFPTTPTPTRISVCVMFMWAIPWSHVRG